MPENIRLPIENGKETRMINEVGVERLELRRLSSIISQSLITPLFKLQIIEIFAKRATERLGIKISA